MSSGFEPRLGRRRARRELRLKDVVIFGSLPVLLILYLLTGAIIDYRNARQYDDWWSRGRVASGFLEARLATAAGLPRSVALERRFDPELPDPGLIRLRVDKEAWDGIIEDPLSGWGVWVDGELVRADDVSRVSLRKRGDTSVHWTTPKKSFTLRTRRTDLFKGFRRVGLSAKDVLPQYVSSTLAAEFDLFAPFGAVAPVYLNDRFHGLYRMVEVVDESFLRRVGRLPGSVYRADAAERGEYFKGTERRAFVNPAIWERVAEADGPSGPDHTVFRDFLAAVSGSTYEDHLRLMRLIDRDEVARLMAAMLVVGDPYHMSNIHNQFWYQDPSTGLLHPIPWDLRILDLANPPDQPLNMFLTAALRDPFIVDATLREVRARIGDGELLAYADSITRSVAERYRDYIAYDALRAAAVPPVGDPEELLTLLAGNIELLEAWIADSPVRFGVSRAESGLLVLDLETLGYTGTDLVALDFEGVEAGGGLRVLADTDGDGRPGPADLELNGEWIVANGGLRFVLAQSLPLLPGWDTETRRVLPGSVAYRMFVIRDGGTLSGDPVLRPELVNRITGQPAELRAWPSGETARSSSSWSPWRFPLDPTGEIRLRGDVRLESDLLVGPSERLVIEPGTTVRMAPDVSIVSRGRVEAVGFEDRPIRFVPVVDGVPWGSFALQGNGASGSRFDHVEFASGGGASVGAVVYKGMVSVHWAQDVVFTNALFARNLRSDDALNAVHSGVRLHDCVFTRANLDAIDFDYSSGEISSCTFDGSGNDAIDLMGSDPLIADNVIHDSGDKGISVGEASDPLIFNNEIAGNQRGVEIKDRSQPFLLHNSISGNAVGILQKVKNWRYGSGGWGKLALSVVADNELDLVSDPDSRLTAAASVVGAEPLPPAPSPSMAGGSGIVDDASVDDLAWVYERFGIRSASPQPGLLESWEPGPALDPLLSLRFPESPVLGTDEWSRAGGVTRLERWHDDLLVAARRRAGSVGRPLELDLTDEGARYLAVFELTSSNLESINIRFLSEGSVVEREVTPGWDPTLYRWVTVELPPADYAGLIIDTAPRPGAQRIDPRTGLVETSAGRLFVHAIDIYAVPRIPDEAGRVARR